MEVCHDPEPAGYQADQHRQHPVPRPDLLLLVLELGPLLDLVPDGRLDGHQLSLLQLGLPVQLLIGDVLESNPGSIASLRVKKYPLPHQVHRTLLAKLQVKVNFIIKASTKH